MDPLRRLAGGFQCPLLTRLRSTDCIFRPAAGSMTRPNEPRPDTESMLRVNQAGEYGATRIYAGQLAVLRKDSPAAHAISGMARQEERHLERFNTLMAERRVRPT